MMKVEKFGFPVKRGKFYYFDYANAEEEKAKTYKIKAQNAYRVNQSNILDGTEFFLDVNTLPTDSNNKYAGETWSKDFKYMAFMT
jgi:hypothetical protein